MTYFVDLLARLTMESPGGALTGKVKKFKAFKKWAMKVREKPAPKNPLRPVKPKNKLPEGAPGAGLDLVAMIRGKVGRSALTSLLLV